MNDDNETWIINRLEDLYSEPNFEKLRRIVVRGIHHPDIDRDEEVRNLFLTNSRELHKIQPDSNAGFRAQDILLKFWGEDREYGGVRLKKIPKNAGITLEVVDSHLPLSILEVMKIPSGRISTIVYRNTAVVRADPESKMQVVDRIVIGEGSLMDAEFLDVDNLTLTNILSVNNISKAKRIHTLVIVNEFNTLSDAHLSRKTDAFDIPNPPGLCLLILPESQEFNYESGRTSIPNTIGFIPSKYYPSAFARGIQTAREPYEKGKIDSESWNMLRESFFQ